MINVVWVDRTRPHFPHSWSEGWVCRGNSWNRHIAYLTLLNYKNCDRQNVKTVDFDCSLYNLVDGAQKRNMLYLVRDLFPWGRVGGAAPFGRIAPPPPIVACQTLILTLCPQAAQSKQYIKGIMCLSQGYIYIRYLYLQQWILSIYPLPKFLVLLLAWQVKRSLQFPPHDKRASNS